MPNYHCLDQITFSNLQSQKRIKAAITILGEAVVHRLLAFVLFLMGAKRRDIAEALGLYPLEPCSLCLIASVPLGYLPWKIVGPSNQHSGCHLTANRPNWCS